MARIRIKEIAEAQGLDIAKLSRRADVSYKTVWELWNNPDRDVSIRTLEKLAAALHVPVVRLIENGDELTGEPLGNSLPVLIAV
ncbi:MAG TPA: helix-turn-helix transcriptional regulator [Herpetosiphonaceae bacterium]